MAESRGGPVEETGVRVSYFERSQYPVDFSRLGDSRDKGREFDIETHEATRREKC
jgi:hypothetical protein